MNNFIYKIAAKVLLKANINNYTCQYSENMPIPGQVLEDCLFIVSNNGFNKWLFLKCPCGCGDLLTLSLMKSHSPNWKLRFDWMNRPTLYPSIWKNNGCESHFWIIKGKLRWEIS